MGLSAGIGSPIIFMCAKCRSLRGRMREGSSLTVGTAHRVTLTGRKRRKRPNYGSALGVRSSLWSYEYTCQVCKHTGWSNHKDLERLSERAA